MTKNDTFAGVEALIGFIAVIMIVALFVGFFLPEGSQQVQARVVGSQAASLSTSAMTLLSVGGTVQNEELATVEVALKVNSLDILETSTVQLVFDDQAYQYAFAGYVSDCRDAVMTQNGFYISQLETIDIADGDRVEVCFPASSGIAFGSELAVDVIPALTAAVGVDTSVPQFALNDVVFMFPVDA